MPVPSYGCTAYWIRPDEDTWAELVARCAGATGSVVVETYGVETDTTPHVAMIVSESDDDAPAAASVAS